MRYRFIYLFTFLFFLGFNIQGQNETVTIEAESGTVGSGFKVMTDGPVQYVSSQNGGMSNYPGDTSQVITFTVTFPKAGIYDLYARVRVESASINNDSFLYGAFFGTNPVSNDTAWIAINNLYYYGFNQPDSIVTAWGSVKNGSWKWINVSEFDQSDIPTTFTVTVNNLTQTFQIGGREKLLSIDKFVFGISNKYYTVSALENGLPGLDFNPFIPKPIAFGKDKFLGNLPTSSQWPDFLKYWNQISVENGGKWGSAEGTRDVMRWTEFDQAYKAAKSNNLIFKDHVLIWGNQQPSWIETLSKQDQLDEIKEWFASVAARYPNIDMIDVVNEPLHAPPSKTGSGNYMEALGGSGSTGWDWIVTSFKLARQYFPNSKLLINEYSVTNNDTDAQRYVGIINILKKDSLIDGIGIQGHAFSTTVSATTTTRNLNLIASTGLPIYVSEFDIDGPTDDTQLKEYQRIFPLFWDHPAVKGITLWGWKSGMWRTTQKAYLMNTDNSERPAMVWLKAYVGGTWVSADSIQVSGENGVTSINNDNGSLQMMAKIFPGNTTFTKVKWSIDNSSLATINQIGILSALLNGTVVVTATATDGTDKKGSISVTISNQDPTGINEPGLLNSGIRIFPNPVRDGKLNIKASSGLTNIQIFAIDGNLILEYSPENKSEVSLSLDIKSGIYIIQANNGKKIISERIVFE